MTRSPSCGRLHRQTVKPMPPPTSRLFFHVNVWLDGPWRRHSFKRRQHREDAMAARTCHLGRYDSHFSVHKAARRPAKQKSQNLSNSVFLWSHNQVGQKVGTFMASPHARYDVQRRPPLRTLVCTLSSNQKQDQKKNTRAGTIWKIQLARE